MSLITKLLLGLFALVVLLFCLANREMVTLSLGPDLSSYGLTAPPSVTLPMFLIALLCGAIGFVLGASREYLRESHHRRDASERRREVAALRRENAQLRQQTPGDEDDEIIAALPQR